jgi:hypothetical protein
MENPALLIQLHMDAKSSVAEIPLNVQEKLMALVAWNLRYVIQLPQVWTMQHAQIIPTVQQFVNHMKLNAQ